MSILTLEDIVWPTLLNLNIFVILITVSIVFKTIIAENVQKDITYKYSLEGIAGKIIHLYLIVISQQYLLQLVKYVMMDLPTIKENALNLKKEHVISKDVISVWKMMYVCNVDKDLKLEILQILLILLPVNLSVVYKIVSNVMTQQNVCIVLMDMFLQIQELVS